MDCQEIYLDLTQERFHPISYYLTVSGKPENKKPEVSLKKCFEESNSSLERYFIDAQQSEINGEVVVISRPDIFMSHIKRIMSDLYIPSDDDLKKMWDFIYPYISEGSPKLIMSADEYNKFIRDILQQENKKYDNLKSFIQNEHMYRNMKDIFFPKKYLKDNGGRVNKRFAEVYETLENSEKKSKHTRNDHTLTSTFYATLNHRTMWNDLLSIIMEDTLYATSTKAAGIIFDIPQRPCAFRPAEALKMNSSGKVEIQLDSQEKKTLHSILEKTSIETRCSYSMLLKHIEELKKEIKASHKFAQFESTLDVTKLSMLRIVEFGETLMIDTNINRLLNIITESPLFQATPVLNSLNRGRHGVKGVIAGLCIVLILGLPAIALDIGFALVRILFLIFILIGAIVYFPAACLMIGSIAAITVGAVMLMGITINFVNDQIGYNKMLKKILDNRNILLKNESELYENLLFNNYERIHENMIDEKYKHKYLLQKLLIGKNKNESGYNEIQKSIHQIEEETNQIENSEFKKCLDNKIRFDCSDTFGHKNKLEYNYKMFDTCANVREDPADILQCRVYPFLQVLEKSIAKIQKKRVARLTS